MLNVLVLVYSSHYFLVFDIMQ